VCIVYSKKKTKQLAYSRRQKENDTFAEIARTLPVSADGVKELDKASILRVAIHYIKLRQFMEQGQLTHASIPLPVIHRASSVCLCHSWYYQQNISMIKIVISKLKYNYCMFTPLGDGDVPHDDNNNNSITPTTTSDLSQDMIKV